LSAKEGEKKRAAIEASWLIKDGQKIGLGTGSTVNYMIEALGKRIVEEKLYVLGVPTSRATANCAQKFKVPLTTLDKYAELDIDIDGADQVDLNLDLIKGMGGALTREKIVASASRQFVIIVDQAKMTSRLGDGQVLPVEVIPFSIPTVSRRIEKLGGKPKLRLVNDTREPFITDNGNSILDVDFGPIMNPKEMETQIKMTPGVVETGLFLGMANAVFIGGSDRVQKIWR
jgi:ribose 5-phosphate isomerase A